MYIHQEVYPEKHICCKYCGHAGEILLSGRGERHINARGEYVMIFRCDRCEKYSSYGVGERVTITDMHADRAIHLDNTVYEAEDDTKFAYKSLIRKARELREKYPHIY